MPAPGNRDGAEAHAESRVDIAATYPRNITHCSDCDRPFPEPVTWWDDYFTEIEDVAFMCSECAENFERGEDHYGR